MKNNLVKENIKRFIKRAGHPQMSRRAIRLTEQKHQIFKA